jgi:hypothetical protein
MKPISENRVKLRAPMFYEFILSTNTGLWLCDEIVGGVKRSLQENSHVREKNVGASMSFKDAMY